MPETYLQIFNRKKVLVTGHTGFKGSWLCAWLHSLGANVYGISLKNSNSSPSHYDVMELSDIVVDLRSDIRDLSELKLNVNEIKPDYVFHLAAQAIVRKSYNDPVETYQTNVLGTLNLLESLRSLDHVCIAILITSDKCYDNIECVWGYRESDALGGPDPYSASKGAAELIIRSHIKSFFPQNGKIRIAVGRAGNVIGGGDWAPDRIVPDCVRSWANEEAVELRNPKATRPWQHVLEPLSGYLCLAKELSLNPELHGEPFNFGPPAHQNHSVLSLVQSMAKYWDKVRWENKYDSEEEPYESGLLKLNCDKALHFLDWHANLNFQQTVQMTAEWYRSFYENPLNIHQITFKHIEDFVKIAKSNEISWAS